MRIVIMGSGVIGVTTAYFLAERGHEVTVIDRQPASALETSFANGGQLSYSHAEPWAHPSVFGKLVKWLGRKDAPLVFRLQSDPVMWHWALKFLSNCTTAKNQVGTTNMLRLALYSKQVFRTVLNQTGIDFSYSREGILHFFEQEKGLALAIAEAEFKKNLGCPYEVLDRAGCVTKEPALGKSPAKISGGVYFPADKTGDIHTFTVKLAELAATTGGGVTFLYNTTIKAIQQDGEKVTSILTDKGEITGDAYVMALGSYSPVILKTAGIRVPIYPLKGYSISIPTDGYTGAPTVGLTDQSRKIVFSRLGNILRVAGTAELSGYNTTLPEVRLTPIVNATRYLFPECGDFSKMTQWACLRSSTPDGSPILGKSKFPNLYFNTGQGSLGWTISCGSSRIVADMIDGKTPEIDLAGLTIDRF